MQIAVTPVLVWAQFICFTVVVLTGPVMAASKPLAVVQLLGIVLCLWSIWAVQRENAGIHAKKSPEKCIPATGPFYWIRYPIYTGLLLYTFPMIIELPTLWRLLLWFIFLGSLIAKISLTERIMEQRFPDFSEQRKRSKRLIPFIY